VVEASEEEVEGEDLDVDLVVTEMGMKWRVENLERGEEIANTMRKEERLDVAEEEEEASTEEAVLPREVASSDALLREEIEVIETRAEKMMVDKMDMKAAEGHSMARGIETEEVLLLDATSDASSVGDLVVLALTLKEARVEMRVITAKVVMKVACVQTSMTIVWTIVKEDIVRDARLEVSVLVVPAVAEEEVVIVEIDLVVTETTMMAEKVVKMEACLTERLERTLTLKEAK